ncbi:PTS glucitol/sorbitol transporter subunit IIA [Terribacillus sp. 7520-G]|uniref:PTS glucitol/sorbitol transporter subunit IIA n=1 Tax=Terribacillus TaxID=459532 RepID=UPI000BA679EF|nr:PTS glucitol/sorbitol transporter subunit IIA [Terribacillus sp. 7520-G]PAD39618.1 PTS sorbitol transporter subunit IIA [Terribacillus sp. 7520-G]
MYQTIVKEIGPMAQAFEADKIVILFGMEAPAELKEISFLHQVEQAEEDNAIKEGGTLIIDGQEFLIEKVGSAANENLQTLGHISIYFTEPEAEVLPGAVFASPHTFPVIQEGSKITFK